MTPTIQDLIDESGLAGALRETADWPLVLPWNGRCEIGWGPCWDEAQERTARSGRGVVVEYFEVIATPDAPCQAVS